MFDIEEELKKLPARPGVYIMHGENDEVIYVGKAISLRNRVRQYFQSSRNKGVKIERMVTHIRRFEYIVTDSEMEALILECNLIKEHRPKYNTMLMDDKSYPYIKVTLGETYPRVLFSHRIKKDNSKYFGPYTNSGAVRDTLELIRKIYKLRTCNRNLPKDTGKERPCLNYHIHQCNAPCQGNISPEEYMQAVEKAMDLLNGNYGSVIEMLKSQIPAITETIITFLKSFCGKFGGYKIKGVEKWYGSNNPSREWNYTGKIDCILAAGTTDSQNTGWTIIDYKNTKSAMPKIKNTKLTEEGTLGDFQMPMYITLMRENEKIKEINLAAFYAINSNTSQNNAVIVDDSSKSKKMEDFEPTIKAFEQYAERFAQCVKDSEYPLSEVDVFEDCGGCNYKSICRYNYTIAGRTK